MLHNAAFRQGLHYLLRQTQSPEKYLKFNLEILTYDKYNGPSEVYYMSQDVRKPVLGVSDKVRFNPACSATGTS